MSKKPVDQTAFRKEAARLASNFGMDQTQAEMLAAVKFWSPPRRSESKRRRKTMKDVA